MLNWFFYKFWFRPVYYINIYFKSGNIYNGYFLELKTKTNPKLIELNWKILSGKIIDINIDEIEFIHSKKYNWSL